MNLAEIKVPQDAAGTLLSFGGAVKATGGGNLEGYLVLFGTPETPDTSSYKDFFASDTDYDLIEGMKSTVYYHHGLNEGIGKRSLGKGELKADSVGVWIAAQMQLRDEWEQAIYDLALAGKLGWSSGTAAHLVERYKVGAAHKVTRWPLGLDASVTPTPADPRTAVAGKAVELKTYLAGFDMSPTGATWDRVMAGDEPATLGDFLKAKWQRWESGDLSDGERTDLRQTLDLMGEWAGKYSTRLADTAPLAPDDAVMAQLVEYQRQQARALGVAV